MKPERGEVGKVVRKGKDKQSGKWECKKTSAKMKHIWHLGMPLVGCRLVSHIFRKLF